MPMVLNPEMVMGVRLSLPSRRATTYEGLDKLGEWGSGPWVGEDDRVEFWLALRARQLAR